jgi:hypothetical protein
LLKITDILVVLVVDLRAETMRLSIKPSPIIGSELVLVSTIFGVDFDGPIAIFHAIFVLT